VAMCTQWRWEPSSGRLQTRTWRDVASAPVPAWTTVITDVLQDPDQPAATYPFEVLPRLLVGNENADARVSSETTFVARNSSENSVSNADADSNGQSDTQVCVATAGRP
jgi:hypothetical protein